MPVHHSNCRRACATSISRPPIVSAPAARAQAQQLSSRAGCRRGRRRRGRARDRARSGDASTRGPRADRRRVHEQIPAGRAAATRRPRRASSRASAAACSGRRAAISTRAPCALSAQDGRARGAAGAEHDRALAGQPRGPSIERREKSGDVEVAALPAGRRARRSVFTAPIRRPDLVGMYAAREHGAS